MHPFDLHNILLSRISSWHATIAVDARRNEKEQIVDACQVDAEPPQPIGRVRPRGPTGTGGGDRIGVKIARCDVRPLLLRHGRACPA